MKKIIKLLILVSIAILFEASTYSMEKSKKTALEPKSSGLTPEQRLMQRRLRQGQFVSSHAAMVDQTAYPDIDVLGQSAATTSAAEQPTEAQRKQSNETPDMGRLEEHQSAAQLYRPQSPTPNQSRPVLINEDWVLSDETAHLTRKMVLDNCIAQDRLNELLTKAIEAQSQENVKILVRMGAYPDLANDQGNAAQAKALAKLQTSKVLNKLFPQAPELRIQLNKLKNFFDSEKTLVSLHQQLFKAEKSKQKQVTAQIQKHKKFIAETQATFDALTLNEQNRLKIIGHLCHYQRKHQTQ